MPREVLAVRYGGRVTMKSETFLNYHLYREPDAKEEVDYYFWVIRDDNGRVVLVDTGFAPEVGRRRQRDGRFTPARLLPRLGIDPDGVATVVVTHAHWDHIGNLAEFPAAEIVISQAEYDFWTSPLARRAHFAAYAEESEIAHLVTVRDQGRLTFVSGQHGLAPGIELVEVGGHTPGELIVVVSDQAGKVVLASDAMHHYEEIERDRPYAIMADLPAMYRAYDLLAELAAEPGARLVAGHDPRVRTRFAGYGRLDEVTDLGAVRD